MISSIYVIELESSIYFSGISDNLFFTGGICTMLSFMKKCILILYFVELEVYTY